MTRNICLKFFTRSSLVSYVITALFTLFQRISRESKFVIVFDNRPARPHLQESRTEKSHVRIDK